MAEDLTKYNNAHVAFENAKCEAGRIIETLNAVVGAYRKGTLRASGNSLAMAVSVDGILCDRSVDYPSCERIADALHNLQSTRETLDREKQKVSRSLSADAVRGLMQ